MSKLLLICFGQENIAIYSFTEVLWAFVSKSIFSLLLFNENSSIRFTPFLFKKNTSDFRALIRPTNKTVYIWNHAVDFVSDYMQPY